MQKPSSHCYACIKHFEGCKLKAYPDPATGGEPWTIGYGHTGNVYPKLEITDADADNLLRNIDIPLVIERMTHILGDTIVEGLPQGAFDALCSFFYNIKITPDFKNSHLVKYLKAKSNELAADELLKWIHANGKVMPGLVARREAERKLFLTGVFA